MLIIFQHFNLCIQSKKKHFSQFLKENLFIQIDIHIFNRTMVDKS